MPTPNRPTMPQRRKQPRATTRLPGKKNPRRKAITPIDPEERGKFCPTPIGLIRERHSDPMRKTTSRERENCLRLAETLASFLARLRESAETLDIAERQRIVRLLVRNVLVGDDEIIIRHSIPMARTPRARGQSPSGSDGPVSHTGSCLLRTGSAQPVALESLSAPCAGRLVRAHGQAPSARLLPADSIRR